MQQSELQLYERVLERMLAAQWIADYRFSGGGLEIQWAKDGRKCACLLKKIIRGFELNTPEQAVRFDVLCTNSLQEQPRLGEVSTEIARFWRDCLEKLHLTSDEIDFMCMVQGLTEFGPDDDGSGSNRAKSERSSESESRPWNRAQRIGFDVMPGSTR